MIDLREHPEGVVLRVAAQPGTRRNAVAGVRGEALRVAVTAAPERGQANRAIADVLAEALGCRASEVRLQTGPTHREKSFLIVGHSPEQVRAALAPLLTDTPRAPRTDRSTPHG